MSSPAPAARAAGAKTANTPAPIIEPRPMTTASVVPSRLASAGLLTSRTLAAHLPGLGSALCEGDRRVLRSPLATRRDDGRGGTARRRHRPPGEPAGGGVPRAWRRGTTDGGAPPGRRIRYGTVVRADRTPVRAHGRAAGVPIPGRCRRAARADRRAAQATARPGHPAVDRHHDDAAGAGRT